MANAKGVAQCITCGVGAALALLLAGCSTVSSIDLSTTQKPVRKGAYINYSVAKSYFVIQIAAATPATPAPVTASPAASTPAAPGGGTPSPPPGGGGGGAAPAPGAATTPTVTATAPAQPVDASNCAIWTAEYTAGQTAVAANISAYAILLARLSQMAGGNPAAQDTPALLSTALGTYETAVRDPSYLTTLAANNGTLYNQIVTGCAPKVTVQIQQMVYPDTARTFALRPQTNYFYTDSLTIGTDANGFLTNGAPASTSQVTAIASAIAGDIGTAITPTTALVGIVPHVAPPPPSCVTATDIDHQIANLAKCPDAVSAHALLAQIQGDLDQPGAMANLPAALLPVSIYLPIDKLEANTPNPTDGMMKLARDQLQVTMTFNCSDRLPKQPTDSELPENAPTAQKASGVYDGIVVSAPRACEFTATQTRAGVAAPVTLALNHFWAQDSRYLTILPTDRGFLVPRTVSYTFAGGQATGVVDSRPSEALAFVSFPGTVLGSFFGAVTTATTNNQAVTNAKTAALTAQYNNLTAQVNVLNEAVALQKAKAAQTPPSN